jgi:hypothetical protein
MSAVGIRDFSIQEDLYNPKRLRVYTHLSALINFAKFREGDHDILLGV